LRYLGQPLYFSYQFRAPQGFSTKVWQKQAVSPDLLAPSSAPPFDIPRAIWFAAALFHAGQNKKTLPGMNQPSQIENCK